jgi:hypothetical protein
LRICLSKRGKSLGLKCAKKLAVAGHKVTPKVADGEKVPDSKKII